MSNMRYQDPVCPSLWQVLEGGRWVKPEHQLTNEQVFRVSIQNVSNAWRAISLSELPRVDMPQIARGNPTTPDGLTRTLCYESTLTPEGVLPE